ncbi:FAD-dependent oxidoreductase [Cellulomonas humilata]|uniref:NAD(P)/FAD-dependent oxidoreductase n=1 Tax=Cellulomonas humilata TaxID=144055 RepID=UPI0031B5CF4A
MTAPVSLWFDQLPAAAPLDPLDGDTQADVVVVGGGLTGLWTAYYLLEADPSLDVLVVEAEVVGFGASGRNGGWCSALLPVSGDELARLHGHDAAAAMRAAMRDTVVEVGGVAAAEQIECGFAFGGTVTLARNRPQLERVAEGVSTDARWGDESHLLGADGVEEHVRATSVVGGSYTPDSARIHPLRLVRGLLDVVLSRGARVAEGTRALRLSPRAVVTDHGIVRARYVVRATEAWSAHLPGSGRSVAPVYSHMIATEPLPPEVWAQIGLDRAQTFTDARNLIVYGQRTTDDRIAFGGRGAPYHVGSGIRPEYDQVRATAAHLAHELVDLFPVLERAEITHHWGGPLGVHRDWHPSVGLDDDGIGWAGGYVGDGVAMTNLAGRTLADLLTGSDSELTRLPWVGHRSPAWEPEPLRWAGITATRKATTWADRTEARTGHASRWSGLLEHVLRH